MKNKFIVLFCVVASLQGQKIDLSHFYYRDYLDFGQNKGSFNAGNSTLTSKDGASISIPNVPNFEASSNYGSLTAVGRGFVVTANHVSSPTGADGLLRWGLTDYQIAEQENGDIGGISKPYGRDEKFMRLDKYVVEGQVDMLDTPNSLSSANATQEQENINKFKAQLGNFKDNEGNIYIYQAGSGIVSLQGTNNPQNFNTNGSGEMKGGGFGTLGESSIGYECLVQSQNCDTRGIMFNYYPNSDFNNKITSGDSGSGIYAYDKKNNKWVLLGVTSQEWGARALISLVSNKDLEDYRKSFEQTITLTNQNYTMNNQGLNNESFQSNKDIIFSGGGDIEVTNNIYRNISGQAGGFVFADSINPTKYTFSSTAGQNYSFSGSGLDIGKNVEVEWALRNKNGETLHKIGEGTLIVKTNYTGSENLGYLKIGQGKVIFDTTNKAYNGVYITSGRAVVELKSLEALGAVKNANGYVLEQKTSNDMGFYFGKGGGVLDLWGNSLELNTISANDNKAIIINSQIAMANLSFQGFGYDNGAKSSNKKDTIIHASIGGETATNLNLKYENNTKENASLIFDGGINIKGSFEVNNANIVFQGHPTAHATISNTDIINKIQNAENGTSKKMPDYIDLSKPSSLNQPDWDTRNFTLVGGINLTNSTLSVGKGTNLNANISADNGSSIIFGGTHFIDEKDTKNVVGSGFSYTQLVKNGLLQDELYEDSSYIGKISANGAKITSNFFDFSPNLELKAGASLNAKYLTLNATNTLSFEDSKAVVQNLKLQGVNDLNKIKLSGTSSFEVQESFIFDDSTFDLSSLNQTNIQIPQNYDLTLLNGSNVSTQNFQSSNLSAKFVVSNSRFNADTMSFDHTANITLDDKANLTLTDTLQARSLNLELSKSSILTANSLNGTLNSNLILDDSSLKVKNADLGEKAGVKLNNKATLELENALTSKDLTLSLSDTSAFVTSTLNTQGLQLKLANTSTFTAQTLNASGAVNFNADDTSSVAIKTLNLNASTAHLGTLAGIENINLQGGTNAYFNDFDINGNIQLKSDKSSKAHINKLSYKALNAATKVESSFVINSLFELNGLGKDVGQNSAQDKLDKDLFALEFENTLDFQNNAQISISFTDKVSKDNNDLEFDKFYLLFKANDLQDNRDDKRVNFSFANAELYTETKTDKNALWVKFLKNNPKNLNELGKHIDPKYLPLLEILFEHNENDENIDKAAKTGDYVLLQKALERLDTNFKNLTHTNEIVLKTLPLLQKQEINARIQNIRFVSVKYAYNDERFANPLQRSDFIPALLHLDKMEQENRAWSNVGGGYFTHKDHKLSLQSASIGYDKKLLGGEFLFGVMASATTAQLFSDELKQSPQIYSLALYSDALLGTDELQNELGFSFFNDKKHIGEQKLSNQGFGSFFNSLYKPNLSFFPKNMKPLILANVNFNNINALNSPTYTQKEYKDLSIDVGLGLELIFEKEYGFYSASFLATRDVFHTEDSVQVSLANANNLMDYETNKASFTYQAHLTGLENFANGVFYAMV